MEHVWIAIMSFSIAPAVAINLMNYRKVLRSFRPFALLLFASLINEIVSVLATIYQGSNALNNNVFILVEWLLLTWLLQGWMLHPQKKIVYKIVAILFTGIWILDHLVFHSIFTFNSFFRITYAFAIVTMTIDHLNALIVLERERLMVNAKFLICCGLIIYFTYKGILEVLYVMHLTSSAHFEKVLFQSMAYINVLSNIFYILASLCLPTKQRFILPYL